MTWHPAGAHAVTSAEAVCFCVAPAIRGAAGRTMRRASSHPATARTAVSVVVPCTSSRSTAASAMRTAEVTTAGAGLARGGPLPFDTREREAERGGRGEDDGQPERTARPPFRTRRRRQRRAGGQGPEREDPGHREKHGHVPQVHGHRAARDECGERGRARPAGETRDAGAQQRERGSVRDADEQQRRGRRVDVRDEVGGVDAQHERPHERQDRGHEDDGPRVAPEGVDPAIGEEEADLLQHQPDEDEVGEAHPVCAGGCTDPIDQHGRAGEHGHRHQRVALVQAQHHRQQCLAEQEDAQEPQRLAEAVTGRRDQFCGHTAPFEHGEEDPDDGHRDQRGAQQAVQALGGEADAVASALPTASQRDGAGEAADHEEQRHHLQQPADRRQPPAAVAGVFEHRALRGDGHADHQRMQHDHGDHAPCADEIDGGVAGGLGEADAAWRGHATDTMDAMPAASSPHGVEASHTVVRSPAVIRRRARPDRRRRRGSPRAPGRAARAWRTPCRHGS